MLSSMKETASLRKVYGQTLVELGKENKDIVVVDADLSCSTQTQLFAKEFPERFFNMGVAEQDAMCTAAGLSTCGKIPFVSTFAIFATGRAYDQVRNGIAYSKFNVKIAPTHGGITVGEDGASHQAIEDIALMRVIPNMVIIVPADATEVEASIKFAAKYDGPVYIRLTRTSLPTIFDKNKYEFNLNKAIITQEGTDVTLIANGETLIEALDSAKILKEKGVSAEVINVPVVKPLDESTIIASAQKTGAVVTIENHSIIGGLGSAVAECLGENFPVKLKRIGVEDKFGQSGNQRKLMQEYGLTSDTFTNKVLKFIGK